MKHIELKMLTVQKWLKTGRLRIHKVAMQVVVAMLVSPFWLISDLFFLESTEILEVSRRDVLLFFPDPCLSWPSMHLTAKKDLDVCERRSTGRSSKSCGEDDEQEPRHSTSRVISTLSWGYYVQMMMTSGTSTRCIVH